MIGIYIGIAIGILAAIVLRSDSFMERMTHVRQPGEPPRKGFTENTGPGSPPRRGCGRHR